MNDDFDFIITDGNEPKDVYDKRKGWITKSEFERQTKEETLLNTDDTPIVKRTRYIDEDFSKYDDGMYLIQANQGTGKTTAIGVLTEENVLAIGARNALGKQTQQKHPEVLDTTHLKNEAGLTHTGEELEQFKSFFINLASNDELTFPEESHDFKTLIVDETLLVWYFTTAKNIVSFSSVQEFKYRLIHTPKVILLGADFPDFLITELRELAKWRKDKNFKHIKYEYPILKGKHFEWLETNNEMWSVIHEHMLKRKEDKNVKGLMIVSNRGDSVLTQADNLQKEYPWAKIIPIYSKTPKKDYEHLLNIFPDPDNYADIDILFISPIFGYGIDIRNEFDLIIGDYNSVPTVRPTELDVLQALLRDRDCEQFAILPRRILKVYPDKYFFGYLNNIKTLRYWFKKLGFKDSGFYERNPITGEMTPRDTDYIKTIIRVQADEAKRRDNCWNNLRARIKELGGTQNNFKRATIKTIPKADKVALRDIAKYKRDVAERIGRDPVTEKDWAEDDEGERKDNIERRKQLDKEIWLEPATGLLTDQNKYEIEKIVNNVRQMFMEVSENQWIITLQHFQQSEIWNNAVENKDVLNALLKSYEWFFDGKQIKIQNDVELDPLYFLEAILRKYHYFTQTHTGSSKVRNEKRAKVRKDNLTAFNKWKETTEREGSLWVDHYLFDALGKGNITYKELSKTTRDFIRAFPHILIEDYGESYV